MASQRATFPTPAEAFAAGGLLPEAAQPVVFNTAESLKRSIERFNRPPAEAYRMLKEMGEHKSFWFALRKHGDEKKALEWLTILHSHSNWAENKKSVSERLRKEYLRLLDDVKFFNPSFRDPLT